VSPKSFVNSLCGGKMKDMQETLSVQVVFIKQCNSLSLSLSLFFFNRYSVDSHILKSFPPSLSCTLKLLKGNLRNKK